MPHILLAEDDASLGYLLKDNLEAEGFTINLCADGKAAWDSFCLDKFDLCILDIMMPEKDGITLGKEIRQKSQAVPIIYLTAKSMEVDKLKAFALGADDYVTKPFSIKELVWRIRSVMRRVNAQIGDLQQSAQYKIGSTLFDYNNRLLVYNGDQKTLSTREADILKLLIEAKGQLVLRNNILTAVWGSDDFFNSKSLDVYLTKIRKLLKNDPSIELQNLYGTGYKLVEKE